MSRPWSLSVIIPALNEAETIGGIVAGIRRLDEADEILVIDDGSSDRTAQIASRPVPPSYATPTT